MRIIPCIPIRCILQNTQGVSAKKNNAIPTWRDAQGAVRCDAPGALARPTLAEKHIISMLSVTVTLRRLAHSRVASARRVATFLGPLGAMGAALPRLPPEATIARAGRGSASADAKKQIRLRTVRRKRTTGALFWAKGRTRTTLTSR